MITQKVSARINPNSSARAKNRIAFIEASEVLHEVMVAAAIGEKAKVVDKAILHLHRAEKYHFNKIALGLAGFLQTYYFNHIHDKHKGTKYQAKRERYQELAHIEDKVDSKYSELAFKLNASRTPSSELKLELQTSCNNFKKYLDFESAPINIRIYILLILNAYLNESYDEVIQLCYDIINWLEERDFGHFSNFYNYLVPALIVQNKYPEAKQAILKALNNVNKNSNNWSIFTYFHFILEIHNQNYQEAYNIFQIANQRQTINRFLKEQWLIVRGYIKFLQRQNQIDANDQFKLDKLFKNMPLSSSDKEGNNINIIILSILLNLNRNRGQIIDRIEAIKKYLQRYLKGNPRARIFIKMLLTLPKYNFNSEVIEFRNQDLWKQLQKNSIKVVGMSEIEIVPFEDLWKMVLKALK